MAALITQIPGIREHGLGYGINQIHCLKHLCRVPPFQKGKVLTDTIQMQYMRPIVINSKKGADYYKAILDEFFYDFPLTGTEVFNNEHVKKNYLEAKGEMQRIKESDTWRLFLQRLGQNPYVVRLREHYGYGSMHCLNVLCVLNTKQVSGIGIFLSLLGNFYGFYFIDEYNTTQKAFFGKELGSFLSYFPLNKMQHIIAEEIEMLIREYFPYFEKFDNNWADYPIQYIETFYGFEESIDLFKVFFSKHPSGIYF